MRSGAAAKLMVDRIRTQRMSVEGLFVESFSEDSKADDERGMVTP
jgi:hypothetical protein